MCYVGRVVEKESSENFGQHTQKSWDAKQSKITAKGLPNTRLGRVELKYHNFSVSTGSANIHYAGSSSTASQGRSTMTSAVNVVSDKGYVKWARASGPLHNYIILHREAAEASPEIGKWCISAVESGDILESDIVIAYINNGTTVRQVWKSDVFNVFKATGDGEPFVEDHPWKVWDIGSTQFVLMTAGSVNNALPFGNSKRVTLPLMDGGTTLFMLNCTFGGGTVMSAVVVPSPMVIGHTEFTGAILLAGVTVTGTGLEIVQYCKNSLWAEQFKCAQQPVEYWFSTT